MAETIDLELPSRHLQAIRNELREFKYNADNDRRNVRSQFENLAATNASQLGDIEAKMAGRLDVVETLLGDRFGHLDERIGRLEDQVGHLDEQLVGLESQISKKISSVEGRITSVQERMIGFEERMSGLEARVVDIEEKIIGLDALAVRNSDRLEYLIARVEKVLQGG